jgi:hypothetical protein
MNLQQISPKFDRLLGLVATRRLEAGVICILQIVLYYSRMAIH